MTGCKPVDTSVEYNAKLSDKNDRVPVNKERYQRLVGKLIYLSHTRPNISCEVGVVSQFMQAPCEDHTTTTKCILPYLKGTLGKGLMFKKTDKRFVEAYTDSDWASFVIDKKSTSGYYTFV
ncbi:uncharacterized mitochondrial protein AtMg00810-like [Benincasa hispida]|uniref:uncharacterized mitochondrial protein AtMg00810-like n=1 Tax=Benincasa hispida TaxID=102211 RepID=UPI0018FF6FA7|nr:uncharacterized mitochondrial protein AtMg00810-like [Benincasa hispida]